MVYACRGCKFELSHRLPAGERCPHCRQLFGNTLKRGKDNLAEQIGKLAAFTGKDVVYEKTGVDGFDEAVGGGLVAGSVILFGGARGAGKSSLMMAVADGVTARGKSVLYVSGEENAADVGKIANRLRVRHAADIGVMGNANDIAEIMERVEKEEPFLTIYDSLQVITLDEVKGSEGSASQGEAVANIITSHCKRTSTCAIIINHMTKLGEFKGSTEVEHLVDTLLTLDYSYDYDDDGQIVEASKHVRMLMSDKNRNGESFKKAYFEMTAEGLKPVRKSKLHLLP
jgi:DNA repair protein RadA/Sms